MEHLLIWCDDKSHCDTRLLFTKEPDPQPPDGACVVKKVGKNEIGWVPRWYHRNGRRMKGWMKGVPHLPDGRWELRCRDCRLAVRVEAAAFDAVVGEGVTGISLAALQLAKQR